jgi:hypothetical protein
MTLELCLVGFTKSVSSHVLHSHPSLIAGPSGAVIIMNVCLTFLNLSAPFSDMLHSRHHHTPLSISSEPQWEEHVLPLNIKLHQKSFAAPSFQCLCHCTSTNPLNTI